ncbi:hypothetical protein NEUTE2DRAFT_122910 [Neurospora tetrasperma FGSC 2509]|nr:hypothetical protein NEUTE2DRAFT_122910 [Neurospora tetrasperma FGSC 2509]
MEGLKELSFGVGTQLGSQFLAVGGLADLEGSHPLQWKKNKSHWTDQAGVSSVVSIEGRGGVRTRGPRTTTPFSLLVKMEFEIHDTGRTDRPQPRH